MLAKKRVCNDNYELYDGLHEPIITQEQWEQAKRAQVSRGHTPTHAKRELMNPFASILVCEKCGAVMKRNTPSKAQKTSPWYRCPTRGCGCRTIKCDIVETEIVKAMTKWLAEYSIKLDMNVAPQADPFETALTVVREKITQLHLQQNNICEYLERGVYTIDMFTKRNDTLTKELRKLQASEADLARQQAAAEQYQNQKAEIIPSTQKILDSYPWLSTIEKNRLWRIVLEKVTIYRTKEGELSLHIYPRLPMCR